MSDSRCFRSARGAQIAVAVALEVMQAVPPDADASLEVAGRLVESWRAAVVDDLVREPLQPDEVALVSSAAHDSPELLAYGSTLLVATVGGGCVDLLQIGDGDMLMSIGVAGDAVVPFSPTPEAQNRGAVETLSLADAPDRCQTARFLLAEHEIVSVLLATDGFDRPFVDANWHASVAADLACQVAKNDARSFGLLVEDWPKAHAEIGGDDTTLGVLVDDTRLGTEKG